MSVYHLCFESDPYYVSSDSDSEEDKPPPMIAIGERSADISGLRTSLAAGKSEAQVEVSHANQQHSA